LDAVSSANKYANRKRTTGANNVAYIGKFRDGWRAQVQRDGARVTKTFKLKKDAQAWALEQESKTTLRSDRTLRHACDNYLKTVSIHKRNAVDWESRRFDTFCAFVGEGTPLADITSEHIGQWRDRRLQTVSGSTVLREANLLRNLFRTAAREWKWIPASPFEGVRLPKESEPRQIGREDLRGDTGVSCRLENSDAAAGGHCGACWV
jgi:hypothetical protein